MKHRVFGRKLGRDINSRKALLSNLASSLIVHGKITTTLAKAKFARPHIEKLVTLAGKNKLHLNRKLDSKLTHEAFLRLTGEIAPGFAARSGGYTRIVKLNPRAGDAAPLARLEFLTWAKKEAAKGPKVSKQPSSRVKRGVQKVAKRVKTTAREAQKK